MARFGMFMSCVGEAIVAKGLRGLLGVIPLAQQIVDVAQDAMRRMQDRARVEEIREEVQAMASAAIEEIKQEAQAVAKEVAGNRPPEEQEAIANYLMQIPSAVRRTFRRAEDPLGKTMPSNYVFGNANDLLAILPSHPPKLKSGDVVPGMDDWHLVEMLGVGGFGEVWKARHVQFDGTLSALKFCLDPEAQRVLKHEATVLNQVMRQGRHPGIVPLIDAKLTANPPWLRYEFIEGGDLTSLAKDWLEMPRSERVIRVHRLIQQLAEIVGHFHQLQPSVIHRDLKPSNILIQYHKGEVILRVADFGIGNISAKTSMLEVHPSTMQASLGATLRGAHTPLYASPQQKRGESPDIRDDIYSVGVIWYQLLIGDLSTGAPTGLRWPEELKKRGVSEQSVQLLATCFEPDAKDRLANGVELAQAMGKLPDLHPIPEIQVVSQPTPPATQPRIELPVTQKKITLPTKPKPIDDEDDSQDRRNSRDRSSPKDRGRVIISQRLFLARLKELLNLYQMRPAQSLWMFFLPMVAIPPLAMSNPRGPSSFALMLIIPLGLMVPYSIYSVISKSIKKRYGIWNMTRQIETDFPEELDYWGRRILRDQAGLNEVIRMLERDEKTWGIAE